MTCDNEESSSEHEHGVRRCPNCESCFCAGCREAVTGSKDRCPRCNALLTDNASCSVTGGCGDGSQES